MNRWHLRNPWNRIGIVVVALLCGALVRAQSGQSSVVDDEALAQLAAIEPIDTHLHAYQDVPAVAGSCALRHRQRAVPAGQAEPVLREWAAGYARDWRYFAGDAEVKFEQGATKGLDLPEEVLRKLYHDNAVKWFPGIE